ncbi:MAG: hypothetical protein AAGB25_01340 [Pseudomonadota bacterium]
MQELLRENSTSLSANLADSAALITMSQKGVPMTHEIISGCVGQAGGMLPLGIAGPSNHMTKVVAVISICSTLRVWYCKRALADPRKISERKIAATPVRQNFRKNRMMKEFE